MDTVRRAGNPLFIHTGYTTSYCLDIFVGKVSCDMYRRACMCRLRTTSRSVLQTFGHRTGCGAPDEVSASYGPKRSTNLPEQVPVGLVTREVEVWLLVVITDGELEDDELDDDEFEEVAYEDVVVVPGCELDEGAGEELPCHTVVLAEPEPPPYDLVEAIWWLSVSRFMPAAAHALK